ncbi:MAG: hypothetical protein ACEPOZ_18160 [Marinifilaceae bacterium]|jgi:hypothetical protein
MENQKMIGADLDKVASRLYNFFSDIMERTQKETGRVKSDEEGKIGSLWEFWDNEL